MNHERITEDVRELAALYALGSLTQHEARSFEMHIKEGCIACEAELRRFERTVAGIGFVTEEIKPPESIRDQLMARIEKEPQSSAPAAAPAKSSASAKSSTSDKEEKMEQPKRRPSPPPRTSPAMFRQTENDSSGFLWLYVAAFAVLVVLGITGYAWHSARETNAELETNLAAVHADFENLNILLDSRKEKAEQLDQIRAIIEKPGARIARLVEQTQERSSFGAILWNPEQSNCLLLASLPSAPPGQAYQLWFVKAAERVSAGMIPVDPMGRALMEVSVPEAAVGATSVIITTEPENGSKVPTSPFYATGRFN